MGLTINIDETIDRLNPYAKLEHIFSNEGLDILFQQFKKTGLTDKQTKDSFSNDYNELVNAEFKDLIERVYNSPEYKDHPEFKVDTIGNFLLSSIINSQGTSYIHWDTLCNNVLAMLEKKFLSIKLFYPDVFENLKLQLSYTLQNTPKIKKDLNLEFVKKLVDNIVALYDDFYLDDTNKDKELVSFFRGYPINSVINLGCTTREIAYIIYNLVSEYKIEKKNFLESLSFIKLKSTTLNSKTLENCFSKFNSNQGFPKKQKQIDKAFNDAQKSVN